MRLCFQCTLLFGGGLMVNNEGKIARVMQKHRLAAFRRKRIIKPSETENTEPIEKVKYTKKESEK